MLRLKAALVMLLLLLSVAASVYAQDGQTIHIVQPGENLFRISQQYGVSVDDIAKANDITNTWRIDVGQSLVIPNLSSDTSTPAPQLEPTVLAPAAPTPTTAPLQYHDVALGESLGMIAQDYGLTLDQLAQMNDITNPDLIYAGQRLIVSGGTINTTDSGDQIQPTAVPTDKPLPENVVTHIVQPGETLQSIGQLYGISWLQIAQANNIYDADGVQAGQELSIPGGSVIPGAAYSFISAPAAPPARIGKGKEIIVDLSDQRTYAYQDGKLIRNVLSATGLPDSPTVTGSFKVQRKYIAQTMTGPGYYLPDVPYVMYFYAGYALHGTYWHNNFGHQMSHGCVNLPTPEAAWFYSWTEIGTPVYVQQ
ncbi:MAG TPA: LysM peptidoglycan-binding domain-containing protein [Phototrophicaceae bacterium]|nr:LysM peptidoglycan-binding domain-containing protein [Phototrophicaceae bacterium]